MGEIILSQAGAALGARLLPGGLGLLGGQLSGAAIGSALGGLAGRTVDNALRPAAEGPRIKALHVMNSADGAGMANIYGRMRVGGQLIWASRFREKRRERRAGKGGPKVADYTYSVSLAVAIAEGPVTRLDRVWANGETLPLSDYNWRLYKGGEDQLPDPLIEAMEGTGAAPAYRGTAYIIFEDMPLDAFGNRLPQLSFEVVRASDEVSGLRSLVQGVNVIPASGEFVYGTDIVRERRFPGIERPLNMNNGDGRADFALSLEQLESDLPGVGHAALTVGWFGDDLRAGSCQIRPGVETRERASVPYGWTVAGQGRGVAHLVSQTGGSANYGGTPADRAVIEGIQAMKAQGLAVTLSPFLFMDVPAGNGLPDPYGGSEQAAFPWRGRITASADGTAAVRSEITAFLGSDHDFGFRHFILHHARLAVEAGGVEAILIGSEMRGLTRLRDETGAFPFVEGLVQLAADVKAIVGVGTKVSYAADWTEYGAYVPADGSGDVLFPLDTLWASADVDFVGVDWYPPAGDWREGDAHLDALAGYEAADDPAYLASQMADGEAYDWYYASPADRDAQIRRPITDTAHGEDWIFRQKDLAGWWGAAHHERPGGVRQASPTAWTPGMKPVRLMEVGFPAVDKGANGPNVFYDPKSSESVLPPYSTGARNDLLQRHALEVALAYWQAQPFMEQAYVWAWDGRPWPDFPVRESVWSDGPNWALGHWLNGRTGLISLAETVEDLGARAGVSMDASALDGVIEGFALDGPMALRRALEPLNSLQPMTCHERESGLVMTGETGAAFEIAPEALAEPGLTLTHTLLDKRPGRLQLSYISAGGPYAPATVDARSDLGEPGYSIDASLPLVLSEGVAAALARDLLAATLESDEAEIALPPACLALEPGDAVTGVGLSGVWRIGDVTEDGLTRRLSLTRPRAGRALRALSLPRSLPETA
ncbi:baseplate multidomain protein megatron, partial [Henriciella aquimarina]|uniref:baseplate multidomain protein megatron n=1 Tax=Henriciella aquimarina TaxID=545261 RepID=UPI000A00E153